jgi:hypothetical protein
MRSMQEGLTNHTAVENQARINGMDDSKSDARG